MSLICVGQKRRTIWELQFSSELQLAAHDFLSWNKMLSSIEHEQRDCRDALVYERILIWDSY